MLQRRGEHHAQRDTARAGSDQCSATQGSVLFSAVRSWKRKRPLARQQLAQQADQLSVALLLGVRRVTLAILKRVVAQHQQLAKTGRCHCGSRDAALLGKLASLLSTVDGLARRRVINTLPRGSSHGHSQHQRQGVLRFDFSALELTQVCLPPRAVTTALGLK